jgi:hypothetical protein
MAKDDLCELTKGVIQDAITKNITVLYELYDKNEKAFSYRVYFDILPRRLFGNLHDPVTMHLLSIALPHLLAHKCMNVKIDYDKDLKYIGLACVGLSKYILITENWDSHLLNMLRSNLEYLIHHQSIIGALNCRYVHDNTMKRGTDGRSIAETTASFLWALTESSKLYSHDEIFQKNMIGKAKRAATWLITNKEFLIPQEIGRSIYGLSELYNVTREKNIILWINNLGEELAEKLSTFRSFGRFADDVDTIGGLSLASYVSGKKAFLDIANHLMRNQLINQGTSGKWRWAFDEKTGCHKPLYDITYSVHQLGMVPWAFSLYFLASTYDRVVDERVMKGISWILTKKVFMDKFIVRSFSGLTGDVYELEQRSYEPGLNILGLLSYSLLEELRIKRIPLNYVLSPNMLNDHYGLHPHRLTAAFLQKGN